jgi:hypothetical protein
VVLPGHGSVSLQLRKGEENAYGASANLDGTKSESRYVSLEDGARLLVFDAVPPERTSSRSRCTTAMRRPRGRNWERQLRIANEPLFQRQPPGRLDAERRIEVSLR